MVLLHSDTWRTVRKIVFPHLHSATPSISISTEHEDDFDFTQQEFPRRC